MNAPAAARLDDPVAHSHALAGFLAGALVGLVAATEAAALVGAVVGAAALEVGTAGLATPLVVGVAATALELGVGGYVGAKLMGAAEEAGEALGASSLGPASGKVSSGSRNVRVNGRPAAHATVTETCHGGQVAQGSRLVAINGLPASRIGDKTSCGAQIVGGSTNVAIGGPPVSCVPIQSEVPEWVRWATLVVSLLPALGQAARGLGTALAEVEATGLSRALQTGAKAMRNVLEERGGAAQLEQATIASRRATAQSFYAEQGWPQARIDSHLKGIDFTQPVEVVTVPANTTMGQWQTPGGPKGNYFAPIEETPGSLGISSVGHDPSVGAVSKVQTQYVNPEPVRALSSRAASISDDWSSPYATAETRGGGQQYFVPDPGTFP